MVINDVIKTEFGLEFGIEIEGVVEESHEKIVNGKSVVLIDKFTIKSVSIGARKTRPDDPRRSYPL